MRLNPEVPAEFERIIQKVLEKDRDLRYQHASEMRAHLKRLMRETESGRSAAEMSRESSVSAQAASGSRASGAAPALATTTPMS